MKTEEFKDLIEGLLGFYGEEVPQMTEIETQLKELIEVILDVWPADKPMPRALIQAVHNANKTLQEDALTQLDLLAELMEERFGPDV